jgi:hypothetical protein
VTRVSVRILHPTPVAAPGPLVCRLSDARRANAERLAHAFRAAGAGDVAIVTGPADDTPFGVRLRALAPGAGGLVVLGSGAVPLARPDDVAAFLVTAASDDRVALANNRFSADVVAIARATCLRSVPDLAADNALPRWLAEVAGYRVADLARRWRLGPDIDSPLDELLLGAPADGQLAHAGEQLAAVRRIAGDRRAELLVAGRTSATALRWMERSVPARVRALVEERGLHASSRLAMAGGARVATRPARSVLGMLLDRDGPDALGDRLAELAEAAVVDTRVLLAHRLGPDEQRWPEPEDRFASDLLLPEHIGDPWLRRLTASAAGAPIPIVLGGHTLVGPGLRLAFRPARWT